MGEPAYREGEYVMRRNVRFATTLDGISKHPVGLELNRHERRKAEAKARKKKTIAWLIRNMGIRR